MTVLAGMLLLVFLSGCGESEKSLNELAVGNWTHLKNRAYILLITYPRGEWHSSVRMTDVTSKIVSAKGSAKGTWHIENGQMILTVSESDIEKIWEKNATLFYDITLLDEASMHLTDESGYTTQWRKSTQQTASQIEEQRNPVVHLDPIVVNLNKNRSNDKDRYLCLNLNMVLKELMPEQRIPLVHPRAKEAALIFLSSLEFNDVKDFDSIKDQAAALRQVLNPHMEGVIKEIVVEHVIVASEMDKVEEFLIEHTLIPEADTEAGEAKESAAAT